MKNWSLIDVRTALLLVVGSWAQAVDGRHCVFKAAVLVKIREEVITNGEKIEVTSMWLVQSYPGLLQVGTPKTVCFGERHITVNDREYQYDLLVVIWWRTDAALVNVKLAAFVHGEDEVTEVSCHEPWVRADEKFSYN